MHPPSCRPATSTSFDLERTFRATSGRLLEDMRAENGAEPATDPELLRVLHAAVQAAQQSRRRQIDGAIVLAAVVGDGKSPAAGPAEGARPYIRRSHSRIAEDQCQGECAGTFQTVRDACPCAHAAHQPLPWRTAASSLSPQSGMSEPVNAGGAQGAGQSVEDILAAARARIQQRTAAIVGKSAEASPAATACRSGAASAIKARHCPGADLAPVPGPDESIEEARSSPAAPRPPTPPSPPTPLPPASGASQLDAAGVAVPAPSSARCLSPRRSGRRHHFRNGPCSRARGPTSAIAASRRARQRPAAPARIAEQAGPCALARWQRTCVIHSTAGGQWRTGRGLLHPPREGPGQRTGGQAGHGPLVETIPRRMRVGVPSSAQVRISRDRIDGLILLLMKGRGMAHRPEALITRALSVRLRAPDGGFWIEAASPETQWVETASGPPSGRATSPGAGR